MSQKQTKNAKKFTVKQVLMSLEWSINGEKMELYSPISDEFVTIELSAINKPNGKTE